MPRYSLTISLAVLILSTTVFTLNFYIYFVDQNLVGQLWTGNLLHQSIISANSYSNITADRQVFRPASTTPPLRCSPHNNILFLKTHKTGSSTIANIFYRYGDLKNLTFALPGATLLGWPKRFQVYFPFRLQDKTPDILCNHARFNKKHMNWLFPKTTSKYVTILRNPVDNFESAFRYMNLGGRIGMGDDPESLKKFLTHGISFTTMRQKGEPLIRNPLMFDLGFSFKYYQNITAVNEYIRFLEKEFDLVMVMDYFDESLVLMKRLLCWEIEDILYLKLNERQDNEKGTILTSDVRENIKRWNRADVLLFEYFNQSLWIKIENEGENFYEELASFRKRRRELQSTCVRNETRLETVYNGKTVKGYFLREGLPKELKAFCGKLTRTSNSYLRYLRKKHEDRVADEVKEDEESWDLSTDLFYDPVELEVYSKKDILKKPMD